ncbi:MAG: hypothetical protein ACLSUC_09240 [Subdoligranulum sp.]|jgi:hypothetical protein
MALLLPLWYACFANTERSAPMSKLTVTIPDDLHQKIREELE